MGHLGGATSGALRRITVVDGGRRVVGCGRGVVGGDLRGLERGLRLDTVVCGEIDRGLERGRRLDTVVCGEIDRGLETWSGTACCDAYNYTE